MATPSDLPSVLAAAAASINTQTTLANTLQSIVDVASTSLPDVDHVGITVRGRGALQTSAASDPLVLDIDRAQYELEQGPCVLALADGSSGVVISEDLRHEGRWHEFVLRAVPLGLRAAMAVRLSTDSGTVGVLNMYSTSSDTIGAETRFLAQLFATHAAYAYGHRRQVSNLQAALDSRELIGNAVGVVMERYELDRDRAFEYLVRVAASSEVKLRAVAEELLRGVGDGGSAPTAAGAATVTPATPEDGVTSR